MRRKRKWWKPFARSQILAAVVRQGCVAAADAESLGVACIEQVLRVDLERGGHLGRVGRLLLVRLRRPGAVVLVPVRVVIQRERGARDALAHGQLEPVGERITQLAEGGDLAVERGVSEKVPAPSPPTGAPCQ